MNLKQTMATLKKFGKPQNAKIFKRHGAGDDLYGVSFADLARHAMNAAVCAIRINKPPPGSRDANLLAGRKPNGEQHREARETARRTRLCLKSR